MRIPKQVRICGNIWKVKIVSDLVSSEGAELAGLMSPDQRMIYLDDSVPASELPIVFLHEFNHAVLHEVGFHTVGLNAGLEELIVENLARQYVACFKMNPKTRQRA